MQIYALKLFNFMRFGEKDNSVVFDLTKDHKRMLKDNLTTMDEIYNDMHRDPVGHLKEINKIGLTNLIGISGVVGGSPDRSNGVGKSTVLEAICYALYDKVIRKNVNTDKIEKAGTSVVMRLNGEIPSHVRESYVELIFEENDNIYRLKRSRTFSKNHKSHKASIVFDKITESEIDSQAGHRTKDTNESILNVINMDYDVFVNSVMFGQKDAGRFLKGTDKVRKEMIINLLQLENVVTACLEEVRERKNSQNKEIENFKAQIEIIKESLENRPTIENLKINIKQIEALIKSIDENIISLRTESDKLASSDILQKVKIIKEDGAKVKADYLNKKEQKTTQLKEWNILIEDSISKIKIQQNKITVHIAKIDNMKIQGQSLKKQITEFDIEIRKKNIEKAKIMADKKPEYLNHLDKLQKQKEEIVNEKAIINAKLSLCLAEADRLKKQKDNANNKIFTCDKCKSEITLEHLEEAISKNEIAIKIFNKEIIKISEPLLKVNEQLNKINDRINQINEVLINESKIKSELKEHESDQIRIKDLQNQYKIELDGHKELEKELGNIQLQKESYNKKITEISKQYDNEISNLKTKIDDLGSKYLVLKNDADNIEIKIKEINNKIILISNERDNYNSKTGSLSKEIETINIDNNKLIKLQEDIGEKIVIYNRLVMLDDVFGLEGVQTRIIQKYLPLLNVYTKEMLDILTDGEISAELYINDRSHVDISIKGNVGSSFDMVSGGEQQDVRLAMSIGLALLSFSRSAKKPEMICLDEIFGSLDNARVASVFKLLALLKDKFERVLVISHKVEINNRIPNQLLLEKADGVMGLSKIKAIVGNEE